MKPRCCQRCCQMGHHGLKAEWLPGAKALLASGNAGAPGGIRTPNLLIRSQMLYPLSHGCWVASQPGADVRRASLATSSAEVLIQLPSPAFTSRSPGLSFWDRAAAAAGTAPAGVDGDPA